MLIFILIVLFILSVFYTIAIIKMASQRHFFKTICVHVIIFSAYIYIAYHFEKIFKLQELFGYHKLEFVIFCMTVQLFVGYYLVQSKYRQKKIREFLRIQKKGTKRESENSVNTSKE